MGFLFSIIFFFFLTVLLVVVFALGLLRSIFGFRRNNRQQQEYNETRFDNNNRDAQKIFDKTEGEYVDFEEITGDPE